MPKVSALNKLLRRRRLTLVPDWQLEKLPLERHLARLLEVYDITCVIDVGANLGQFRDLLVAEVGWNGPLVSFEPVKSYLDVIRTRADGRKWRVIPVALGNEDTLKEITIMDSPGLASLKEADFAYMRDVLPKHAVTVMSKEFVQVKRLQDVFEEAVQGLDARRVFLKIDTQGYDLDVFRGAAAVLDRIAIIQAELPFLPIYQNMPDATQVITEFRAAGYEVSGMFPVRHDDRCRVVDMDGFFVSSKHANTQDPARALRG